MSDTGRLRPRQREAIRFIVTGMTDQQVADALGVHRVTVTRWRNSNAAFMAALNSFERQLDDAAAAKLRAVQRQAVETISEHIQDPKVALRVALGLLRVSMSPGPTEPEAVRRQLRLKALIQGGNLFDRGTRGRHRGEGGGPETAAEVSSMNGPNRGEDPLAPARARAASSLHQLNRDHAELRSWLASRPIDPYSNLWATDSISRSLYDFAETITELRSVAEADPLARAAWASRAEILGEIAEHVDAVLDHDGDEEAPDHVAAVAKNLYEALLLYRQIADLEEIDDPEGILDHSIVRLDRDLDRCGEVVAWLDEEITNEMLHALLAAMADVLSGLQLWLNLEAMLAGISVDGAGAAEPEPPEPDADGM